MIREKISIIISLYNKEAYIEETIESVLQQTYTNFELIIVDDGSTDGSGQRCEKYALDERVKIYHTKNQGMSAARKYGLDHSSGEWITVLDADDILDNNFLEILCGLDTDAEIISTGITILKESKRDAEIDVVPIELSKEKALLHIYYPIQDKNLYLNLIPGKLIKKSLYDQYFDVYKAQIAKVPYNFFDDVFLIPYIMNLAPTVCVYPAFLYKYRIVEDSSCHSLAYRPFHYEQVEAAEMVVQMYQQEGLEEVYLASLPNFYLVAHKAWYAAYICKIKNEELESVMQNIERITLQYYTDFKKNKKVDIMKKSSIILFKKNRSIWTKIMKHYFGK